MEGTMEINFGPTEQILWPLSVFSGVIMCKVVYEITARLSTLYFKGYSKLNKSQKIEWNNRGFYTFHAIVAAAVSFYLLVISDTFKEGSSDVLIIDRKSLLSDAIFGLSLGFLLSDLAMILRHFPLLGGKQYILHHCLSMYSILLSLISGQGQIYILMVLFTEIAAPFVNLKWYLDVAGQKNSTLYIYNWVALFFCWLIARILLFIYLYVHIFLHFDQVRRLFPLGFYSLLLVPSTFSVMNIIWLKKIFRGMMKTLSRKKHEQ